MELAKLFTNLGIAGACLFTLYRLFLHFGDRLFEYLNKKTDAEIKNNKILVEKLDAVIATISNKFDMFVNQISHLTEKTAASISINAGINKGIDDKLDRIIDSQIDTNNKLCVLVERKDKKR